ncbi:MAG: hypothetical protein KAX20_03250 [Candidatus Omnitrophica bacterium]|nr:hypothetical protein [Candidatus Omnitrophota bacterium]
MKIIIIALFFLTLATYLSYLVFEPVSLSLQAKGSNEEPLKKQIEFIKKNSSKGKTIDFYLTFSPQDIDGYLNEEFFKKNTTGFRAIHTRLLNEEIEIALSTNLLHIPTMFRLRIRLEEREGEIVLSTRGISIGRLPVPHFLFLFLYRRYPWLNLEYLLKLSGLKLKEFRIEKDQIFLKGVWSI